MNVRLLIFAVGPQSNLRKGVFETDVQLWYRSGKIGMNRCAQKYHNRTSVLGPDGFIRSGKSGIMEAPGYGLTNAHRFCRRDALPGAGGSITTAHRFWGVAAHGGTSVFECREGSKRPFSGPQRSFARTGKSLVAVPKRACNISPSGGRNECVMNSPVLYQKRGNKKP